MKLNAILSYVFVGIPGGCLIIMGMLMLNAVLDLVLPTGAWTMMVLLCLSSLGVGLMARWIRPYHGLGSAIASGLVAAGIILALWLKAVPGVKASPVFGPAGMLEAVAFSSFGGWIFPRLTRRSK